MSLIDERFDRGRLRCERIGPEHAAAHERLMLDPALMGTLWARPEPPQSEHARASLEAGIEHWERHGFGLWMVREAASGEIIGRGGLEYLLLENERVVEGAWAITPSRWGEGLATELAETALEAAFSELELDSVLAVTLPHNHGSRRVMDKTGFVYEREVVHAGLPHVLYRAQRHGPSGWPPGATRPGAQGSGYT